MKEIAIRNQNREVVGTALVDDEDFARLSCHRWSLHSNGYAVRMADGRMVYMHREVLALAKGRCDHKNRNPLDNRKTNLRLATQAQNLQNVSARGGHSSHRGVTWDKRRHRWIAQAKLAGRQHFLGYFDDEQSAAVRASEWRAVNMPFSEDAAAA